MIFCTLFDRPTGGSFQLDFIYFPYFWRRNAESSELFLNTHTVRVLQFFQAIKIEHFVTHVDAFRGGAATNTIRSVTGFRNICISCKVL